MNTTSSGNLHCAGRFSFLAPEEMRETGRSQSIYRTNVSTVGVEPDGAQAYWHERLAQIRAIEPPAGSESVILRTFELQPGVSAVWYVKNRAFPDILALESMMPLGLYVLAVDREAEQGKESLAETLVKDIVDSYAPSIHSGFCVGQGAITLEPSRNEQASVSFAHATANGLEVELETRTVPAPDTTTHTNVEEEKDLASSAGGSLTILRDEPRSAAGLPGKEIRISVAIPGDEPFIRFTWHYPGVGGSSEQPAIDLVGSAPADRQALLETIWETLLNSLRAVPLAPAQAG